MTPCIAASPPMPSQVLSSVKSKIGFTLLPQDQIPDQRNNDELHHQCIMFQLFHRLLESGYHSFATLFGVVARKISPQHMEVCALKRLILNKDVALEGASGELLFHVKCTPNLNKNNLNIYFSLFWKLGH